MLYLYRTSRHMTSYDLMLTIKLQYINIYQNNALYVRYLASYDVNAMFWLCMSCIVSSLRETSLTCAICSLDLCFIYFIRNIFLNKLISHRYINYPNIIAFIQDIEFLVVIQNISFLFLFKISSFCLSYY